MTEYGTITTYNHDHQAAVIEAESDGAQIVVDQSDFETAGNAALKRHARVAFDRYEGGDGHLHARNLTMLQPIGSGGHHRHIGDRRFRGISRNPL